MKKSGVQSVMKRSMDLVVSIAMLIAFSPVILVTALFVRWKLGSPVLFAQERPGLGGKMFLLYKFRTMTDEKDGMGRLLSDHLRLTAFGRRLRRLSLDELPQLFNVIKGELSLVGPRPLLPEYLPLYNEEQARRHSVKPGITGWAQVNGRNAISWEEKFKFDLWYVDNQSILLDIKILILTMKKVVRTEGITQHNHVTMEKFTGSKIT